MPDTWTDRSAVELAAAIRRREVTSADIVDAFISKINDVNPALNALVVDCFESAREQAHRADDLVRKTSEAGQARETHSLDQQPLLGVPVSIKEMFDVAGTPTTAGLMDRKQTLAKRDAAVVSRLRTAGAIVLGKTNVPQLGMLPESDNPVYGRTNNPHDLQRTCGGSSGGEAALLAANASVLGLASDGGGSIRLPAHFCGVMGLKPTGGRLSMLGHWLSTNWPHDWVQPGPMARCVADLRVGYQALCGSGADWQVGEIHGEAPVVSRDRPPRVGVFSSLETLPAGPTARRAVETAAGRLTELGLEVVPVELPRASECWDTFMAVFYADALRDMRRQTRGQKLDWRVRQTFTNTALPRLLRPLVGSVAGLMGQGRVAALMHLLDRPHRSADAYCQLLARVAELRRHYADWMVQESLDFLLGPAGPGPAFPHGDFYASFSLSYTSVFNLLAMPAGAMPMATVSAEDVSEWGRELGRPTDWCERSLAKANADSEGLPFGIQLVAPWWQERSLLDLMGRLEAAAGAD